MLIILEELVIVYVITTLLILLYLTLIYSTLNPLPILRINYRIRVRILIIPIIRVVILVIYKLDRFSRRKLL